MAERGGRPAGDTVWNAAWKNVARFLQLVMKLPNNWCWVDGLALSGGRASTECHITTLRNHLGHIFLSSIKFSFMKHIFGYKRGIDSEVTQQFLLLQSEINQLCHVFAYLEWCAFLWHAAAGKHNKKPTNLPCHQKCVFIDHYYSEHNPGRVQQQKKRRHCSKLLHFFAKALQTPLLEKLLKKVSQLLNTLSSYWIHPVDTFSMLLSRRWIICLASRNRNC